MANTYSPGVSRVLQKAYVVDLHLSKLAQGFSVGESIADDVLPRLVTTSRFGRYIAWDANAFKFRPSGRAMNAKARRNDYDYELKAFAMPDGYTAEFAIDDREDQATTGVGALNLPLQKMRLQQGIMAVEREINCANLVTDVANYTSHGNVTNYTTADTNGDKGWANVNTDIYRDVLNAQETVANLIGKMPKTLVISRALRTVLPLNPSLQKFALNTAPGAATAGDIPLDVIAKWLRLDSILVGEMIYTNDNGVRTNIWGNAFASLLYLAPPAGDTPIDPQDAAASFGWTLQLQGYPKVRKYRDESTTSLVGAVDDNYLQIVTSNDAGYFFQNVLGS